MEIVLKSIYVGIYYIENIITLFYQIFKDLYLI